MVGYQDMVVKRLDQIYTGYIGIYIHIYMDRRVFRAVVHVWYAGPIDGNQFFPCCAVGWRCIFYQR